MHRFSGDLVGRKSKINKILHVRFCFFQYAMDSDNVITGAGIEMSHDNGVLGKHPFPGMEGVLSEKVNGTSVSNTKMEGPDGSSEIDAQLEESVTFNSSAGKIGNRPIIHEQSNCLTISKVCFFQIYFIG